MNFHFKTSWKTQFNILWFGQMLVLASLSMSLPYLPLYIAELGNYSAEEIRFWSIMIYMAPLVTAVLCSPLWGKVADRVGYKPMVIRASLGLFITETLILLFADVYFLFFARLLQGVLAGISMAAQAWALSLCPDEQNGATIGKLQSATAIGELIGPLLGSLVATFLSYHSIFKSSSIICGLVALMFFFFLQNSKKEYINNERKKEKQPAKTKNMQTNFQQQIIFILVVIILIQLARQMITPIFTLFITEKLGGGDMAIGILYAATGLMIFITGPWWGKLFDSIIDNQSKLIYIVVGLLITSALLQALQAYVTTVAGTFILRLLWGACLGALLPVMLQILIKNSDKSKKGLFLGFSSSATKFGGLAGVLLGALIELFFGFTHSFLTTAIFYLISSGIMYFCLKPKCANIHMLIVSQYPIGK